MELPAHDRTSSDGQQSQDTRERSSAGRGARWGRATGRGCVHSEIMSLGFSKVPLFHFRIGCNSAKEMPTLHVAPEQGHWDQAVGNHVLRYAY